ncbi:MAG: DUF5011 domain-containing protein [Candidatus Zambryskibacteria bacterium]
MNNKNPKIIEVGWAGFMVAIMFLLPIVSVACEIEEDHEHENTPPAITLIGANPLNLTIGDTFTDPGATATDTEDGDLTSAIITSGTVDTAIVGSYEITYSVTDSGGLSASVTRTVVVSDVVVPPPPVESNISINASKIVCDSESDLPNWGLGGPDITVNTASEFITSHPNCHLESGWNFQWANNTATDPGGSFIGEIGGWNNFGPTNEQGVAVATVPMSSASPFIWVREVLKTDYLTFSYPGSNDSNSAEMYCRTDVLNYDNYDRVDSPFVLGETYYCVAFNVSTATTTPPVNTPPTITLIGANPLTLTVGDTFIDPGATATDLEDGDATTTSHIIVTGTVDASTTGSYILTYSVTDSGGLSASTTRTVVVSDAVVPPVVPPVTPPGGGGGGGGGGIGGHRHPIVAGEILGATSCLYLIDYLKIDWKNDPIEVLKLQSFLNVFEGESLSLTGVFNQSTFEAVQRFQVKYSGDILAPWGDKVTTGFVYILTKKKINEIYCNTVYPVSQAEQNEIDTFRSSGGNGPVGLQTQSQDISTENLNGETSGVTVVNLSSDSDTSAVSTSVPDSVVKNLAVSLFSLPQKIFGNSKYFVILLVLVAIAIAFYKLFSGPKDSDEVPVVPVSGEKKEESLIIILPSSGEEKKTPELFPDEEIVIENPEEGPDDTVITTPDLRDEKTDNEQKTR